MLCNTFDMEEFRSFDVEKSRKEMEKLEKKGIRINKIKMALTRLSYISVYHKNLFIQYCKACSYNEDKVVDYCDQILKGGDSFERVLKILWKYRALMKDF